MRKLTQRQAIKMHLHKGLTITPMEALNLYGCFRLAAIIHHLKDVENMDIKTTMVENLKRGKSYARYNLRIVIPIN